MKWFFSDPHFNHQRLWEELVPARRQFNSVQHMNQGMLDRLNAMVGPDDDLYCLGDFCMGQDFAVWAPHFAKSLPGKTRTLIVGNHDTEKSEKNQDLLYACFDVVAEQLIVEELGKKLWLAHFPTNNEDDHRGYKRPNAPGEYDYALCGHVHDAWKLKDNCLNVGVDVWNFYPINLAHIINAFNGVE